LATKEPSTTDGQSNPVDRSVVERLSGQLVYWAVTSSLAGFLFGFDTVVISGAEQAIEKQWHLYTLGAHNAMLATPLDGFAVASALYGTIVGALFGGLPSDKWGRKPTLIVIGLLYLISAVWSALSGNVYLFILARIIGGFGVGASTVVAPVYISEIAPPKHRGWLTGSFQFNIVFGIIVALFSNYLFVKLGPNAWRWMFGVAAVPSLIYTIMCFGLPESPRWLLGKGNRASGVSVLKKMQPYASDAEIDTEADTITAAASEKVTAGRFWTGRLQVPIMLAFLVAFFNQWSGINAVLYFAPHIFELAGFGRDASFLKSIGIGITNLLFTFVGLYLIDRLGRKTLLYIGSFGYIASLGLTAWAFFTQHFSFVPVFIFAFIAAHAVGQGSVIWVYISEIFPAKQRAEGQALGCSTHWIMAAIITTIFPVALSHFKPGYIFLFFAFMMVLQLIWTATMVVETKGRSLEEVQKDLGIA
jgi:sugar porter (SP) family MFS transporter